MQVKVFNSNIVVCVFKEHKELALTFARVSEFYESSNNLRNKYFSFEEFVDANMKECGELSYFEDWGGFNIPGKIFMRFMSKFQENFTNRELKLVEAVINNIDMDKDYYVIGAPSGDIETIRHEVCHAFYACNKKYHKKVHAIIDTIPPKKYKKLKDDIIKLGYIDDVVDDELNAYLATTDDELFLKENFTMNTKKIKIPFVELFDELLQDLNISNEQFEI